MKKVFAFAACLGLATGAARAQTMPLTSNPEKETPAVKAAPRTNSSMGTAAPNSSANLKMVSTAKHVKRMERDLQREAHVQKRQHAQRETRMDKQTRTRIKKSKPK